MTSGTIGRTLRYLIVCILSLGPLIRYNSLFVVVRDVGETFVFSVTLYRLMDRPANLIVPIHEISLPSAS